MIRVRALAAALAFATPAAALASAPILVHRDPGCGCCEKWAAQVRAQFGRKILMLDDASRSTFQKTRGIPADLGSCHTAVVDGMTFEGHVPVADMKRALRTRFKGVTGLAVAGMPMGSPGMEMSGMRGQPYDVVAFGPTGRRVFARHGA